MAEGAPLSTSARDAQYGVGAKNAGFHLATVIVVRTSVDGSHFTNEIVLSEVTFYGRDDGHK